MPRLCTPDPNREPEDGSDADQFLEPGSPDLFDDPDDDNMDDWGEDDAEEFED